MTAANTPFDRRKILAAALVAQFYSVGMTFSIFGVVIEPVALDFGSTMAAVGTIAAIGIVDLIGVLHAVLVPAPNNRVIPSISIRHHRSVGKV